MPKVPDLPNYTGAEKLLEFTAKFLWGATYSKLKVFFLRREKKSKKNYSKIDSR